MRLPYSTDGIYKLWFRELHVGSFEIEIKTGKKNFTACCSYARIKELKFIEPTIILTKKPQEEKQPFYEVQF